MLLPHRPELFAGLRTPTEAAPLRLLVSGCLAGWSCGVDGTDYGMGGGMPELMDHPKVQLFPFCPEQHGLGTPRTMPDIHGGDGFDVLKGQARVLDEHGADLTDGMLEGAEAMRDFALESRVELAFLTDMSAACGSQVISLGCRLSEARRYQLGVGVATATLLQAGILVFSQRDFASIARLRAHLDTGYSPPPDALDHHESPWVRDTLAAPHPRAGFEAKAE